MNNCLYFASHPSHTILKVVLIAIVDFDVMMIRSDFRPALGLHSGHVQTCLPFLLRIAPRIKTQRERVILADGDFIDLEWAGPPSQTIVVLLHGLTGSRQSNYIRGMMATLIHRGLRVVLMQFRGCGEHLNRLPRMYHFGDTPDLDFCLKLIKKRHSQSQVFALGFSMGGSVLLKWLGEHPQQHLVDKAVAVSVPFELHECATRLNQGFSKFYQWYLLSDLKKRYTKKFKHMPSPLGAIDLKPLNNFFHFDDAITAKLHGFQDVKDYYTRCSCRPWLKHIQTPTLIISAEDDPFITPKALPQENELSSHITFELSRHGGHLGFIAMSKRFLFYFWLEKRIPEFFLK